MQSCLGLLIYLPSKTLKLFVCLIFWLWAYLMKVIQETCPGH